MILYITMRVQTNINLTKEIKIKLQHLSIDKQTNMNKLVEDALNQVYFKVE